MQMKSEREEMSSRAVRKKGRGAYVVRQLGCGARGGLSETR